MDTLDQFNQQFEKCFGLYLKKHQDYGSSWREFLPSSLTDQIYIKLRRIKTINTTGVNKVGDSIEGELQAIVNYGIMALIQSIPALNTNLVFNLDEPTAISLYTKQQNILTELMIAKNHDYGEAWREMRISSIVDLMLVKIHRLKQIEDNNGQTIVSEGTSGHYSDIINYALFCLIKLSEL